MRELVLLFFVFCLSPSCRDGREEALPLAPEAAADAMIQAGNVRLDIPLDEGQIVLTGGLFQMGGVGEPMRISRGASLTFDGPYPFTAKADVIRAAPERQVVELSGRVRAGFSFPLVSEVD
jgi:hypothetical protein